jgi:hypothetical protein
LTQGGGSDAATTVERTGLRHPGRQGRAQQLPISESWAFRGIAEHFGGQDYLTYAPQDSIRRTRISDGVTEKLLLANLGEMAEFKIDPATNKCFFHAEGGAYPVPAATKPSARGDARASR